MSYIEIRKAFSIRGETSTSFIKDGIVMHRVYDFAHDFDTNCYHVRPDGREAIPCEDALRMVKAGILPGYAFEAREVICEEFLNKGNLAAYGITAMLLTGIALFYVGKD